jgi:hypothetical protein
MTVYFVERSFYQRPNGHSLSRVEADSVLSCFRSLWGREPDPNLGVPFLRHVLELAHRGELPAPQTMEELADQVNNCVYDPQILVTDHTLQVLSDDDEIEYASHVFDDHYRAAVPPHYTALLLHDDWRLPASAAAKGRFTPAIDAAPLLPKGRDEGTTWFVLQTVEETSCLSEMRYPMRIDGVRVPQLCNYLAESTPAPGPPGGMDWPWELHLLRTQVPDGDISAAGLRLALERTNALHVKELDRLGDGYGAGMEGDLASARRDLAEQLARLEEARKTRQLAWPSDPSLSVIQAEEHLAQLCLNTTAPNAQYGGRYEMYHQWIFFDDLWATAHPDLANGLLRYASRWDLLSSGEVEDE